MSYIVESGASSSRRARRRRALITLGIVAVMLFLAFWYAYSYYQAASVPKAKASASSACTAQPVIATPGTTTVNVYNATQRNGLAAATAAQVRKRGFKVSTISNDPLQHKVAGPAEVRFGKTGATRGALVLAMVKGAKAMPDARTDGSVDLVLGNTFSGLAPAKKPAAAPATTPSTGC